MVGVLSLWLPILLSAVIVFVVSSIIHMLLTYHRTDFGKIPSEDEVMEALRRYDIPPGDYVIPCAGDPKVMRSPEFIEKMTKGPAAFMTVTKSGPPKMGGSLVMWFIYSVLVGIFAAYIAGRALGPGAQYLEVFRFVGLPLSATLWHSYKTPSGINATGALPSNRCSTDWSMLS